MANPHVTRDIIINSTNGLETIEYPLDPSDTTFPALIEALGGEEAFKCLPVLDIGDRCGGTGYIDFLVSKDLSSPIMRGQDAHGRPFFSFRLEYTNKRGEVSTCVETLFRRYIDGPVWTSGGDSFLALSAVNDGDLEFLRRLVAGEDTGKRKWRNPKYSTIPIEARNALPPTEGGTVQYEVGRLRIDSHDCDVCGARTTEHEHCASTRQKHYFLWNMVRGY